ncbi:hypothetical protein GWI33_015601 [Rhynchophorus ferrugineus]|uniref:Receptor-binding cancer antigen n=1 Tax=Rhynchophorus ferrugineus TaxID=354439 RepID=A0A834ICY4_RHYFE|nr:hypothetical protein GWI33_015601 [Rhynchophorus ferrugineus]
MILSLLFAKLKGLFLFIINLFRRALCCIRKRKRNCSESAVPLTQVVSSVELPNDIQDWADWGNDALIDKKPKTVQDYIALYRQQTFKPHNNEVEENVEEQLNFFEDMTPQITKQTKVLIRNKNDEGSSKILNNRLNAIDDSVNVIPSAELGEWNENSGWDGEQLLDHEAQRILREQKKLDREKRLWEQNQKKIEKHPRVLGSKLMT